LREAWPQAEIEVVLPREGPIAAPLRALASRVSIEPLFILRRRGLLKLIASAPFRLPVALARAIRRMRGADLVYINTMMVADYLLAARFFAAKTIAHVHEIPDGFKLAVFRRLLNWTRAETLFNSKATRAAYVLPDTRPQHVVYNGIAAPEAASSDYDGTRPLRLLMLGRINRIKGQDLLIEALALLPPEIARRLHVRIVGETFENDHVRDAALHKAVRDAGLESIVCFEPFQTDPAPLYRWADSVVVPSRLPEALGRVAIEAMAHRRPPLVARIGGLPEIVEDRVSGWIVAPNDAPALANALSEAVTKPEEWKGYGAAARARFETTFAAPAIARQFQGIVRARLTAKAEPRPARDLARV
jgi:glycosyltransferase involved in cell wall biosynthesis